MRYGLNMVKYIKILDYHILIIGLLRKINYEDKSMFVLT